MHMTDALVCVYALRVTVIALLVVRSYFTCCEINKVGVYFVYLLRSSGAFPCI